MARPRLRKRPGAGPRGSELGRGRSWGAVSPRGSGAGQVPPAPRVGPRLEGVLERDRGEAVGLLDPGVDVGVVLDSVGQHEGDVPEKPGT